VLAVGAIAWWVARPGGEGPALDARVHEPKHGEKASVATQFPSPVEAIARDRVEQPKEPAEAADAAHTPDESGLADASIERLGLLLHVVDAETLAELRDCEVGSSDRLDRVRGDSPLWIAAPSEGSTLGTLRVAVDRYATAELAVEWTGGGERTVELEPKAGLTVVVPDAAKAGGAQVRVRRAEPMEERLEAVLRQAQRNVAPGDDLEPWVAAHERALARLRRAAIGPDVDLDLAVALQLARGERTIDADADGRARFDELPAGRWIVDASAPPKSPPRAAAKVALTAGAEVTLELPLQPPPKLAQVRAAGLLRFDQGWLEHGMPELPKSFEVRAEAFPYVGPVGPDEAHVVALTAGDRREEFRFDAGQLPPGRVRARFGELHWSTSFDVPAAGSDSIEIVVPPPSRVAVRAFDASAPEVATPFQLAWESFDGAGDGTTYPFEGASRSDSGTPLDLVVPRGTLLLFTGCDRIDYFLNRSRHDVGRAIEQIAVELRAFAKVSVTLREGPAIVPCEHAWAYHLYLLDPRRQPFPIACWETSSASPSLTITFDGEGPATLHLEPSDGYAMVAPVAVELKRGETVKVELPITRARRGR